MATASREIDAAALRRALRGRVIAPGDEEYEEARRVWNGAIDRRPALIARCAGAEDIAAAVRFARERGLALSVRGGGHNVAGSAVCDGGVVVDLSGLRRVAVDPAARTARAGPGVLWGEMDAATAAHGLATTGGIQSTTGIAGFTLGGGIGWLSRLHGHACDNLLEAEVVTAGGGLVRAAEDGDRELLFGLRGGGGNFGVAASLTYRLHPLREVTGGMVWHPRARAGELLHFFREWSAGLPDAAGAILFLVTGPAHLPAGMAGEPVAAIGVCHAGPAREAEAALAPLRAFGPPALDGVRRLPYPRLQQMLDPANPPGCHCYWKAEYLADLDDAAIAAIAEAGREMPRGLTKVLVVRLGGAAGRVPEGATAFGHRAAPFILNINGMTPDPGGLPAVAAWVRALWEAARPSSFGGVYVNFLGDEGADRVRAAYPPATLRRLVALKRRLDPDNVFRLNQNIDPAWEA